MVKILIQRAVSGQNWKWLEKSAGVVNNDKCSRGIIIVNKPGCYFTETFSLIKAHKISDQRQTWQTVAYFWTDRVQSVNWKSTRKQQRHRYSWTSKILTGRTPGCVLMMWDHLVDIEHFCTLKNESLKRLTRRFLPIILILIPSINSNKSRRRTIFSCSYSGPDVCT